MARIMAIDYGRKRIGLAVTDELQLIATALETVPNAKAMAYIAEYVAKESVEAFVLGMPVNLDGTITDATMHTKRFSDKLKAKFPDLPVHWIDERYTSKMAERAMIDGGMKKKNRRVKANVDKVSAVIILQSYLEQQQ